MKQKEIILYTFLSLFIIFSIVLSLFLYDKIQEVKLTKENNEKFIKDYTIATNYIDSVIYTQKIAEINFKQYTDYTFSEYGYEYIYASTYLDNSYEMLDESIEQLRKSRKILENLSYNEFFNGEIQLRLKQIDLLTNLSKKRMDMIDYSKKELYEINYGSESKAEEINKKNNEMIESFNIDIENSIELDKEIDIYWKEDFYP